MPPKILLQLGLAFFVGSFGRIFPDRPLVTLQNLHSLPTDVQVYFCDPQSPWQRATNENTNLLLRQYFLRGTDLSPFSQAQLDQVSLRLNQRPRKTLGFQTPASRRQASVASTV
jgi:IS30 family transposase